VKIRNKTSLWIAFISLSVGIFSGLIVFTEMREESFDLVDMELLDLAERIVSDLVLDDKRVLNIQTYTQRYYVKVTNNSGDIVFQSSLAEKFTFDFPPGKSRFLETIDISYDLIWLNPEEGEDLEDLPDNGVLFRVIVEEKIVTGGNLKFVLAKPLPLLAEDFREVETQIIAWSIVAALLVICLSYLFAGRILLPLKIINSQIREINQTSLSRRIPFRKSHDELYELTVSLNSMFDRLQDSFAKQREFIGNAAHEIKTPITSLLLSYENILNKSLPIDLRTSLESQQDTLRRVSMLVKNLLDISRLEQQESLHFEKFDLFELIDKVLNDFEDILADSQIELLVNAGKVEYFGDRLKIQRMLVNIIDNAIKYTQPPGTIDISIKKSTQNIHLEISNTGAPIPPGDYDKIFDQFYRVDKSHSSRTGGVGLGLAIVKKIVELHEGTISVTSDSGTTSFKINLPNRQI